MENIVEINYGRSSPVIFERSKFDAAGQMKEFSKRQKYGGGQQTLHDITTITTQSYDGDGERVKEFEHSESTQTPSSLPQPVITQQTEYYARSSVTGKIITELDAAGAKKTTKVYVGSALLAEQRVYAASSEVVWQHGDPVTGSVRQTLKTGAVALYDGARSRRELEPLGGIVPPTDPYFQEEINTPEYEYGGDIKRPEFGCTLPETGQPAPCNVAAALANHIGRVEFTIGQIRSRNARRHPPRLRTSPARSRADSSLPDDFIGADNRSNQIQGLRLAGTILIDETDVNVWVVDNSAAAQGQTRESRNMRNFREAVQAVRDILGQDGGSNPCANFFGGAGVDALDNIVSRVNSQRENETFTNVGDTATGISMRIPTRVNRGDVGIPTTNNFVAVAPTSVAINTGGAFVSRTGSRIGNRASGTLESRVIQLLHEIGHLVITDTSLALTQRIVGGQSRLYRQVHLSHLLALDDGNTNLSEDNTDEVRDACDRQINRLNDRR